MTAKNNFLTNPDKSEFKFTSLVFAPYSKSFTSWILWEWKLCRISCFCSPFLFRNLPLRKMSSWEMFSTVYPPSYTRYNHVVILKCMPIALPIVLSTFLYFHFILSLGQGGELKPKLAEKPRCKEHKIYLSQRKKSLQKPLLWHLSSLLLKRGFCKGFP